MRLVYFRLVLLYLSFCPFPSRIAPYASSMLPLFYLPFDLAMSRVLYFAGKRILYLITELSYVLNENSKNYQSSLFGKKYMYVSVPFRLMYGSSSFLSIFCHFFARIVDFLRKKNLDYASSSRKKAYQFLTGCHLTRSVFCVQPYYSINSLSFFFAPFCEKVLLQTNFDIIGQKYKTTIVK